jgi:hypothetical protein
MKASRIIAISVAAIGLLIVAVFVLLRDTGGSGDSPLSFGEFISGEYVARPEDEGRAGLYATDEIVPGQSEHIIEDVRAGRIDLLAELRRLRSYCGEDMPALECDELVLDFLYRLPEPDGGKLVQLFDTYRRYEAARRAGALREFAALPPAERYAKIKAKRREIFGEEDAGLVFGLEEAHADFQELVRRYASGEFAQLPPAERLAAFEEARAAAFGEYYETLREREPADARLGMELLVRQSDWNQLPEAERRAALHAVRVRHLGRTRADEIARTEARAAAETAARNEKLERFLKAEAEFHAGNSDLSAEERRARIEELRAEIYGD